MNDIRKFISETLADFAGELKVQNPGWKRGGTSYSPENLPLTSHRREVKRLWNKYADHSFFGDKDAFVVTHELGKFSSNRALDAYFKLSAIGNNPGIDRPGRDELSCVGYAAEGVKYNPPPKNPYFTFRQRRVTFVSLIDVASEWLSKATPTDKKFYRNSGLPKRPTADMTLSNFLLSKDEMWNTRNKSLSLQSREVIVGNWVVDTYHGHADEKGFALKLGLKFELIEGQR